jgi:hypothetical protein
MENIERRVRREVRAMMRREVITLSAVGISAVMDQRDGRSRRKRIKSLDRGTADSTQA